MKIIQRIFQIILSVKNYMKVKKTFGYVESESIVFSYLLWQDDTYLSLHTVKLFGIFMLHIVIFCRDNMSKYFFFIFMAKVQTPSDSNRVTICLEYLSFFLPSLVKKKEILIPHSYFCHLFRNVNKIILSV